ncbi:hypothetical protein Ahy_A03g014037 [Arachis hypogaea]|uniref:Aminotransferase-like plant mobile domain-containing protein n=1 Tax=Arachis hypogaea TaxID=3818 RepID=A0A445DWU5_ARAHY|nr:hypothetical protein Ahy_A03g014037 [Arachis hypogaea]
MRVTHCDRRASVFVMGELEPFGGWLQVSFRVWLTADTVEWGPYIHPVYRQEVVFKVYEVKFSPIPDENMWPEWYETQLRPNPAMRRKATGKLVSTRFRNEMDGGERQEKRCGLYRQIGHT